MLHYFESIEDLQPIFPSALMEICVDFYFA